MELAMQNNLKERIKMCKRFLNQSVSTFLHRILKNLMDSFIEEKKMRESEWVGAEKEKDK